VGGCCPQEWNPCRPMDSRMVPKSPEVRANVVPYQHER
jgi:hypothetical protein